MEIKKETLVVILEKGITDFPLGVVIFEIVSDGPRRYLVRTKSKKEVELSRKKLFPLCQGVSQETDFDTSAITEKLPEIIRTFATILCDQQKQIDDLKK